MTEFILKKRIKLLYHFSYDIIKTDNEEQYQEIKEKLIMLIKSNKHIFYKDICESTILIGFDNVEMNLFQTLDEFKKENKEKFVFVISKVMTHQFNDFEIVGSEDIFKK